MRAPTAGFTLLELLVVLVVVGITLSFAVVGLGTSSPGERVDEEARRLQALLRLAGDEAVLRGRTLGVHLGRNGYRFLVRDATGWQPLEETPLHPRRLDHDLVLALAGDGRHPAATDGRPHLWLFPDGQITPFELALSSGAVRRRVVGERNGEITIERP